MIREPAVAGQFYPANPQKLQEEIRSYWEKPETLLEAKAIVAPHAGYLYSGPVAGAVYSSVRLESRYIILGPNHTGRGVALSIFPDGEWRTPLGNARIDTELNEAIMQECGLAVADCAAHAREHSIEVQIPFLQSASKTAVRFSAICVGTAEYKALESLGHALARAVKSVADPVLMIASSDMSHYETAETAAVKDRQAIENILKLDPVGLYRTIIEKDVSMCGFAPTVALIIACRDLGAAEGRLIRYANSGDASGDYDRVVGYAGIAIL
jgi:AmmeMemoRadiSam system protein B